MRWFGNGFSKTGPLATPMPYARTDAFVIAGKLHATENHAIVAAVAEHLGKNIAFARAAVENADKLIPLLQRAEELRTGA